MGITSVAQISTQPHLVKADFKRQKANILACPRIDGYDDRNEWAGREKKENPVATKNLRMIDWLSGFYIRT